MNVYGDNGEDEDERWWTKVKIKLGVSDSFWQKDIIVKTIKLMRSLLRKYKKWMRSIVDHLRRWSTLNIWG